jgi:glycosyltransferase involved in cell wall biosynthesis
MNSPFVAVFMVTYNHENYIGKAIESALMQKTTFPMKIIIGEDCSTDLTAAICRKYQQENPLTIEVIFNKENIGASRNAMQIFESCFTSGAKYIAMLEGDDYWTDPYKLQKQVDFLEANDDFAICFHDIMILKNGVIIEDYLTPKVIEETDIMRLSEGNYMHTPSVLFRNNLFGDFPEQFSKVPAGDYFLHMLNARYGKIKKISEVMAVYRMHNEGVHSNKNQAQKNDEWLKQLFLMIPCFEGDVKSRLITSFLKMANSVLFNTTNLSIQRQNQIYEQISEISPNHYVQLMTSNKELTYKLNSPKGAIKTIIKMLKRKLSH